jgi:hypothetical protein
MGNKKRSRVCSECGHAGADVVCISDNGYRTYLCADCAPDSWEHLKALANEEEEFEGEVEYGF